LASEPGDGFGGDPSSAYRSTNQGFHLDAPQGWAITETNFEVFHYNDVFLTINSQRPRLALQKVETGLGEYEFGPRVVRQLMYPGEIYMSFSVFNGPGPATIGPDAVTHDLLPLLATNAVSASGEPDLSKMDLRFFKRGRWWDIAVYMRGPITRMNRRNVMATLRSVRFDDAPVSGTPWAESLAWQQLPEGVRASHTWPVAEYGEFGSNTVRVETAPAGYSVKLAAMGDGAWSYLVFEDGRVSAVP
jgi:hypothetical protein